MVTLGGQRVDTQGFVPDEELRSPFLFYQFEGWRLDHSKTLSALPFVVYDDRDVCVYLLVYLTNPAR